MGSPTLLVVFALLFALRCMGDDNAMSGTAFTSRYYDCCKPSCGWKNKADFTKPVLSCDAKNNPLTDYTAGTGCNAMPGVAYACPNQVSWAVNDTFSYGFVGAYLRDGSEGSWCCACYRLQFLNGSLAGKSMIVQASNTDYDMPGQNLFTFAIPGSNNSYGYCNNEYNVSPATFGANVTGVATRDDCQNLPEPQRTPCQWRFDWFEDAFQPLVNYTRVACPAELLNITGCERNDEKSLFGAAAVVPTSSSVRVSAYYYLLAASSVLAVLVPPLFV